MSRLLAFGYGLGILAATIVPACRDAERDSFPFSTYPMFARRGGKVVVHVAEGVDAEGHHVRLPPHVVANSEVMQAAKTLRRAVAAGDAATARLCERIAERLRDAPEFAAVETVQIVGARFDPVNYFVSGPEPEARSVHGRCRVRERRDAAAR